MGITIHTDRSAADQAPYDTGARNLRQAIWRGIKLRCPRCGEGRLFASFLKVAPQCGSCGEQLHHQRADDAPPYFTMFIVGHVAIGGVLAIEQSWAPEPWVQAAIWVPFIVLSSLWLLPRVKGALVGTQWALRMHGFGDDDDGHSAAIPAPSVGPAARGSSTP